MPDLILDLLPGSWLPAIMTATILLLAMLPVLTYVRIGWRVKHLDIRNSLSPAACRLYFNAFSSSTRIPENDKAAERAFDALYSRWYGRRFFILPSLVYFMTMLLAVGLSVFSLVKPGGAPTAASQDPAIAAVAGAFMWCVNDQISRSRRLDLAPSDMLWASLRMVIAVPLGYSFDALLQPALASFVAFSLGAFPLTTIQIMLRRLAAKNLGTEDTEDQTNDKIIALQGIDTDIVERLRNEDITTITELAYCDPVRLTMRSSLTFSFVVDAMSQALAWLYFEDKLALLRPVGLRGGVEVRHFVEALDYAGDDPAGCRAKAEAEQSFMTVLRLLCFDPADAAALHLALREIAEDPFVVFLSEVWDETGLDQPAAAIASGA